MTDLRNLTWDIIHLRALELEVKLLTHLGEQAYDAVMAAGTRGMVPATIIAEVVEIPAYAAVVSDHLLHNTRFIAPITSGEGKLGQLPRLLVIDTITSETLHRVADEYRKAGHHVITGSLFHQEESNLLMPDYVSRIVNHEVLLPWKN